MIPFHKTRLKAVHVGCLFLASLPVLPAGAAAVHDRADDSISPVDYVDMVDPYIMSARGRWFFFGTGKRPFGMVNVFPDTSNEGQGGGVVEVT